MLYDLNQFASLDKVGATLPLKAFLVLFLIFYIVFAVLVFRQVISMSEKLSTPLSPLLRFISIIHVGVAIAVLLLILGSF